MAPAPPSDERRLEAFFNTSTKYLAAPVPTPLDRNVAIAFVNAKVSATLSPEKMRKLARLAIFYDLLETAPAFSAALTGGESAPADFVRSAYCLIALAWIADPARRTSAQRYFHTLQDRADAELHRGVMLEVVEAFGPSEGTGAHRQWISAAIVALQGRLRQEQTNLNVSGVKLMQEKINALTEYLNVQLPLIDRALLLRQRIESMAPLPSQIRPLVAYSMSTMNDGSPALSFWASMKLLRMDAAMHPEIANEFYTAAPPDPPMIRARALRAAEYFGQELSEADIEWLAEQPDTDTDPLVLRPYYYKAPDPPDPPVVG